MKRALMILLAIVMMSTFTSSAFALTNAEVRTIVKETLWEKATAADFRTIEGETVFNITCPTFRGIMIFSKDYLEKRLEHAKKDLVAMYDLMMKFPKLTHTELYDPTKDTRFISRYASIGSNRIWLSHDWQHLRMPDMAIQIITYVKNSEIQFFLPWIQSEKINQKMVNYLKKTHDLTLHKETIWGLQLPVFKFENDPDSPWILRGENRSTIFYNPKSQNFTLDGCLGWEKIYKIYPERKTIIIKDSINLKSKIKIRANFDSGSAYQITKQ
jgi:hypothetical protein